MSETAKKLWLVEHPTFRYVEDVKALARKADLVVVDAAHASPEDLANAAPADQVPALNLRDEFKPAAPTKQKKEG